VDKWIYISFDFSDSTAFRKYFEKSDTVAYTPSMLSPHQLQVNTFSYHDIPRAKDGGNFIILGLILFFVTMACSINRKIYGNYLKAVFSSRAFASINREKYMIRQSLFFPLIIASYLSFSLFFLFILQVFFPHLILKFGGDLILKIILAALPVLFLFYWLTNKYLSYVFSQKKETAERFQYHFFSVSMGAQAIAPLLLFYTITHSKYLIWIALCIIGILFIIRQVKCFILTTPAIFDLKYFLYLCTVEILPCLLIIKWASLF